MHSAAPKYLIPQENEEPLEFVLFWMIRGQVQSNTEAKGNQCKALDLLWKPVASSGIPVLNGFVQWQRERL